MIYPTNYEGLDKILNGGFRSSSLVVVGGRPGMGKTSFLMSCALNLMKQEINSLFISLEISAEDVVERFLRMEAEVDVNIDKKEVSGIEFQRMVAASSLLQKDFCEVSTERSFEKVKDMIMKNKKAKVVFIDFLQLYLYQPGYEETSRLITELKNLCHEKKICIVVASQLSREIEKRTGRRPMLMDYRDSGAIEETADQSIMLLRRSYYDPNDKPGLAEIIVNKNRYGRNDTLTMAFLEEFLTFENLSNPYFHSSCKSEEEFAAFAPPH